MNAQQRELIESIIRQNPNFKGHEHLMEQFCSEVYKKSYLLLDAVSNIESLKNYLNKVADTSVANVIKSSDPHAVLKTAAVSKNSSARVPNKVNKTDDTEHNVKIKTKETDEKPEDTVNEKMQYETKTLNLSTEVRKQAPEPQREMHEQFGEVLEQPGEVQTKNPYEGLIDPLEFFPDKAPSKMLIKSIIEALYRLDSKEPSKKYLDIFKMRYVDKCGQNLIAKSLKISQSDLSKRFYEMVKYIRQEIL